MEEALIIDVTHINNLIAKLEDPSKLSEAVEDIKKMENIKQTLLWRADAGTCCGSLSVIAASLNREIEFMEKALKAIEKDDINGAIAELEEYKNSLSTSNPDNTGIRS